MINQYMYWAASAFHKRTTLLKCCVIEVREKLFMSLLDLKDLVKEETKGMYFVDVHAI